MTFEQAAIFIDTWQKFTGRTMPLYFSTGCVICGVKETELFTGYFDIALPLINRPVCEKERQTLTRLQGKFLELTGVFIDKLIQAFTLEQLKAMIDQAKNLDQKYVELIQRLIDFGVITITPGAQIIPVNKSKN